MEPSLSDEELQSGDHSTDLCAEKGKEINLVSRQNVDVEGTNSVNIDGEVVSSEFAHIVEGIPTEKNEDKTDARPVEKLICNDMESGAKVNDNKEDPSVNNEEYEGYKRAGLTSFGHMVSVDHNESKHQLVAIVEWYLSRICILWTLVVRSYLLNGQFMTTRLWGLMIAIEYQGRFFKYTVQKIVLEVLTYSTSSRGTILELNPDVPCELMPNFQQRGLKHHSWQKAVTKISGILDGTAFSKSQRREAAQGWKDCMTSVNELAFDGKTDIRKFYPDIHVFQYHHSQMEFTVCAVPRYDVIPVRESSNQPLSDTVDPTASLDDFMTDPQILDQFAFEMRVSRPSAFSPHSVIAQETDQHATHAYVFTMSQNESTRELCTRENNLPAPAFPASISSRSSEGPSQTTSSTFSPIPSADLLRQGDSSQTTDLCPNRSADHHNSNWLQKNNDTKEEVAPNETRSASVDDSLWDAPGTPDTININERGQTEVAALKESNAGETTKNQQKVSETKKEPSPIYPDYAKKTTRIATFKEWSPELKQPEELADCGFYYTGVNDHVRCFHCGILLHEWKREDDPWIEHARHSPKCRHVRMMKGEKFISQAAMMTKERAQRREVAQGWKDCMTSVNELAFDGKTDIRKFYPDIHVFQYHHSQMEFTVCAVPRYDVIPVRESSNQPLSDTVDPTASLDDFMTDPQILDQFAFEMRVSRPSAFSPHSVIAQETDQHATHAYVFTMSQNESTRELCTRENNLPAPAFPASISSRSSEGPSQTTSSTFSPIPSADLLRQGDSSQTTDLCPNRSADHHNSNWLQKNNDTKEEVAPNETRSASVDDSLWDAPGTPDTININERGQTEVAALKESNAGETTKNQQKVSETKKEPSPIYPDYAKKTTRIATFKEWSPELKQPEELADCGFYYTGVNDHVRCFHCGILLHEWKREDDLWIEHARHSPKCRHVRMMKGEKFISQAAMMTKERAQRREAAQGWKDCMTSVNELAFDGKTDIRKFYPDIHVFQYHHSQMEFTVCAVPWYDVIPSADLLRQGDSSQTTDFCPNRSADHHSSNWLQKNNDTKEEVAPNETGSALVDDSQSLWAAPGTPDTININERGQTEVAALKESNAGETTKNQQKVSETKKEPSPIYLDYAEKTTRIATFKEWSPELKQPEEFADCGFYYTVQSQNEVCSEAKTSGPLTIESANMPCQTGISMAHVSNEVTLTCLDPVPGREATSASQSHELRMVVPSGENADDEIEALTSAAKEILSTKQVPEKSDTKEDQTDMIQSHTETESVAVASIEEPTKNAVSGLGQSSEGVNAADIGPIGSTEQEGYLLLFNAELDGMISQENDIDTNCSVHQAENSNADAISGADEGESTGDAQNDLEELLRENRRLRYAVLCESCKINPKCAVFVPCFHRLFCSECATSFRKCPACQQWIRNLMSADLS